MKRDSELSTQLCDLMNRKLPPIEFENVEVNPLVLRRYLFIHTSVAAPVDEATRQPMAIEIYAYPRDFNAPAGSYEQQFYDLYKERDLFAIHDLRKNTFPVEAKVDPSLRKLINHELIKQNYKELDEAARRLYSIGSGDEYLGHELIAEMTLQIYEAVYSNIMFPNISGGIYF